jgi:hypothetical protein
MILEVLNITVFVQNNCAHFNSPFFKQYVPAAGGKSRCGGVTRLTGCRQAMTAAVSW